MNIDDNFLHKASKSWHRIQFKRKAEVEAFLKRSATSEERNYGVRDVSELLCSLEKKKNMSCSIRHSNPQIRFNENKEWWYSILRVEKAR